MKNRYRKILVLLSLVVIILLLIRSCSNIKIEEKETPTEDVIQELVEEPKEVIIEEIVEETIEEPKEETTSIETVKEVIVPSYKMHIGIADGITLVVNRTYSEYGQVGEVIAEVTKLYDGDIITASVTTENRYMQPIYCVDQAIRNDNNTYTVSGQDIIVTTGYYNEKHNDGIQPEIIVSSEKGRCLSNMVRIMFSLNVDDLDESNFSYSFNGGSIIPCNSTNLYYHSAFDYGLYFEDGAGEYTIYVNKNGYQATSFNVTPSPACILKGTKISLADGSTKLVEDLTTNDMLMTYNFMKGDVDARKVAVITKHSDKYSFVMHIKLDNDVVLDICDWQSFFDMDKREYFDIKYDNYADAVGRNIMYIENGKRSSRKIVDIAAENKVCDSYEIFTEYDKNFVANGILSIEPETWFNGIYSINDNYKVDLVKLADDINKYGLYTYDEFKDLMSISDFNRLAIAFKKIAVAKGEITFYELRELYEEYMPKYHKYNYYVTE